VKQVARIPVFDAKPSAPEKSNATITTVELLAQIPSHLPKMILISRNFSGEKGLIFGRETAVFIT